MEIIKEKREDYINSPIINHKDFVRFMDADPDLQLEAQGVDNVHGFIEGKAVVIVDSK